MDVEEAPQEEIDDPTPAASAEAPEEPAGLGDDDSSLGDSDVGEPPKSDAATAATSDTPQAATYNCTCGENYSLKYDYIRHKLYCKSAIGAYI
jgi:hypothetical protein